MCSLSLCLSILFGKFLYLWAGFGWVRHLPHFQLSLVVFLSVRHGIVRSTLYLLWFRLVGLVWVELVDLVDSLFNVKVFSRTGKKSKVMFNLIDKVHNGVCRMEIGWETIVTSQQ